MRNEKKWHRLLRTERNIFDWLKIIRTRLDKSFIWWRISCWITESRRQIRIFFLLTLPWQAGNVFFAIFINNHQFLVSFDIHNKANILTVLFFFLIEIHHHHVQPVQLEMTYTTGKHLSWDHQTLHTLVGYFSWVSISQQIILLNHQRLLLQQKSIIQILIVMVTSV